MIRPQDLLRLRRRGESFQLAEADLPVNLAAAYDMSAAAVGLVGEPVAAWKLGATTSGTRRAFATEEIYYGALFGAQVWSAGCGATPPAPPALRGEAEVAFRLKRDLTPEESATVDNLPLERLFDAWAPVIEAPYSCIENISGLGLRALVMDRCAAGALYMGNVRADLNDPAIGNEIAIWADGKQLAQGRAESSLLFSPQAAARGFLSVASGNGVILRRGQWISTGGITPCVALPFGQTIRLTLGRICEFEISVGCRRDERIA